VGLLEVFLHGIKKQSNKKTNTEETFKNIFKT